MTAMTYLALIPRDGLFCKDGRGWQTSASGRGYGLDWPWPSTVRGAVCTAWGRRREQTTGARLNAMGWRTHMEGVVLGCSLSLRRPLERGNAAAAGKDGRTSWMPWTQAHRAWPIPADAVWSSNAEVSRLDPAPPRSVTLGSDDNDARESLWVPVLEAVGKPQPAPRWWSESLFTAWLAGGPMPARAVRDAFDPRRRVQTHVGIDPRTLTASKRVLYSHDIVETLERNAEWAIGVEVSLPSGELPETATLGSDARLARIEALPAAMFDPPRALLEAFRGGSHGLRLVITSPACFANGWLPDGLAPCGRDYRGRLAGIDADVVLRAAFVTRPHHISGWDMERRVPKPTSRMVPPGAVYFFERIDSKPFTDADARALWLAAFGARTNEGFGRAVPGTWTPRRG